MSPSAAPPTPQEIQRKLSVHGPKRKPTGPVSGTESDSDTGIPQTDPLTPGAQPYGGSMYTAGPSVAQPPLTSIAERRSNSGEDSDEEDDAAGGGWKVAEARVAGTRSSLDEGVIKAGYLWKKGERRKTWKKRWFVLRPAHLAYYKSSAEYQLLRLLDLSDVHSCTQVNLKRHDNTFGLISPTRTFYLQANDPQDVQNWVTAIEEARQTLLATSTQTSTPTPIPIPQAKARSTSRGSIPLSVSPPPAHARHGHALTSSDSEDAGNSPTTATFPMSPSKMGAIASSQPKEPSSKVILSGYLMKCGSKRRNWRKRWFVLSSEKLIYSGSHMDTKPHRQFPFNDILDALEYDLPSSHKGHSSGQTNISPPNPDQDDPQSKHTFKIVTTKRTLLLCAPSEDDEIRWLGAIRALIARRTGSGLVPGTTSKSSSGDAQGQSQHQGLSSSPPASGSSGIKSKVRRMSGATSPGGQAGEEVREGRTS